MTFPPLKFPARLDGATAEIELENVCGPLGWGNEDFDDPERKGNFE